MTQPVPPPYLNPNWNAALSPLDVGDQGSAAALAAANGSPPPQVAPQPAFDRTAALQRAVDNGWIAPTDPAAAQALAARAAQAKAAMAPKALTAPPGPPPGAVAPGVTAPQQTGLDPVSKLLMPGQGTIGTPAHQVGLSPSDKAYGETLEQEGDRAEAAPEEAGARMQAIADHAQEQADVLSDDARVGTLLYQQQVQDNTKKRAALEVESKESQSKIEQQIADMQAQGVDPKQYWQNQTTGQKIAAGISVFLGAIFSGPTGARGDNLGPNQALGIINNAVQQDIEAQREHLTRSLEAAKLKGDLNVKGFDAQRAMLTAERDSIQSGYAVAMNEIAKKASMYKDNTETQMGVAKLTAGLNQERDARVSKINEQLYALMKAGERVVPGTGGAGFNAEAVRKRSIEIRNKAADNGKDISPEEAHRQAIADLYGASSGPVESYSKEAKGSAGKLDARAKAQLEAHDAAISNIDRLLALRQKHGGGALLSPNDEAEADALAARTQEQLVAALGKTNKGLLDRTSHLVPDHPLETKLSGLTGSDTIGTRLRTAKKMLEEESARIRQGSSTTAAEPRDEGNPAGLKDEEETPE